VAASSKEQINIKIKKICIETVCGQNAFCDPDNPFHNQKTYISFKD